MPNNSNQPRRTLLIGLFSTFWLIAALIGYYYTHKPFSVEFVSGMLILFWRLLVVAVILSIAGGIGAWILSSRTNFSPLTNIAMQAALGSGILGLVMLLMGMTIGFRTLYCAIFLAGTAFMLRKQILVWVKQWFHLKAYFSKSGLIVTLVLGTSLILFWTLFTALAPPLQFDALTYHLALPRFYLITGSMVYTPDNIFWGMPQQTEMLYTLAMSLGGAEAATTLGWSLGFLTLLGLLGIVREKFNLLTAWASVACLLGGSSLVVSLASGYTEWPVMLYGLGTVIALDAWRSTEKRVYLLLAAGMAGFALGSKYTAGQLILIGLVIIAWAGLRHPSRRMFVDLLVFGGLAALVSLPWWVKNWLSTSNPFYPLLFPSGAMTPARLAYYNGTPWGTWLDMLILPWQVTAWGIDGRTGFSWSIGPLLLGFGALSWVGWQAQSEEQKRLLSTAAITALTGFVVWAAVSRWNGLLTQTRLYVAFFPAWAILAGIGFDALTDLKAAGIRFGRIAATILLLVFAFNLIEIGKEFNQKEPLAILTGNMTSTSYRNRNLGAYEDAVSALQGLPPNSHVLMLWETRSLACLPICDPDEVIDRWYDDSKKYASPEETLAAWRTQGYTHLLLYVTGRDFVKETDSRIDRQSWDKLDTLLKLLPPPAVIGKGYELYELNLAQG